MKRYYILLSVAILSDDKTKESKMPMEDDVCSLKFEDGPAGVPVLVALAARDIQKKVFSSVRPTDTLGSGASSNEPEHNEAEGRDGRMLVLGKVGIKELSSHAGVDFAAATEAANVDPGDFAIPARRFVLCNGWQSWSFAGELCGRERPRRALKPRLNLFVDHPAEPELRALARRGPGRRADSMVSHFFTVLRVGAARLALVSLGAFEPSSSFEPLPPSNGLPSDSRLPPVTFLIDSDSIRIAVFSDGAPFKAGEELARIAILAASDYFELKDKLAALFDAVSPNRFSSLSFLWGNTPGTATALGVAPGVGQGTAPSIAREAAASTNVEPFNTAAPVVQSVQAADLRSSPLLMGGYETWYNHYLKIDEVMVKNDLVALGKTPNLLNSYFSSHGKPLVFQVDDGWERRIGDWRPNEKFPGGMAALASSIAQQSYIPGLWVAPFLTMLDAPVAIEHPDWLLRKSPGAARQARQTGQARQGVETQRSVSRGHQSVAAGQSRQATAKSGGDNGDDGHDGHDADGGDGLVVAGWNPGWGGDFYSLDLSNPAVLDYLDELFDTIINEWGFRYLKLDFLYAGMLTSRSGEAWKHYCNALQRITSIKTNRAGQPVAFLSCGAPLESTAPFMPLMRIGADTRESWEYTSAKLVRHQGRPAAKTNLTDTLGRSLLDKVVLLNDPDVVFCRTTRISLKDHEKFLVGLVAKMFGSQLMSSDEPGALTDEERQFTEELCAYYDKLEGYEFGVERLSAKWPDVYRFFSRRGGIGAGIDGYIDGVINLSDRSRLLTIGSMGSAESSSSWADSIGGKRSRLEAVSSLAANEGRTALVPAHAMLLFGLP
ncbi:MAG TPA: alpha-galactosidase [Spirochaetales bacterium]|nr:alpha-galactosidase [Spirochaetales bacterium]